MKKIYENMHNMNEQALASMKMSNIPPKDITLVTTESIKTFLDPIQQDLKEIKEMLKHLSVQNADQIRLLSMDEYFKKTAWKYVNGTLHLHDTLMEDYSAVPMNVQIEHERWQLRTFGGIKYEE